MSISVACYGTLRKGFGNHSLLAGSSFCGTHKVKGASMYSLGGFPAIVLDGSSNKAVVEVYKVDEDTLKRLDGLEGFPGWYDRKEISVEGYGTAFIYCMNQKQVKGLLCVESGDWAKQRYG